jgi:hypothetical protein
VVNDARLTWGSTSLLPTTAEADAFRNGTQAYLIEATADGTTWGNPEAVIAQVRSHLQDGSLAAVTSYDNREGVVQLRVTSKTYAGLDAGGLALAKEQRVPGYSTLTWTPNVSLAVPTVFDVVYSTLAWQFDDMAEATLGDRPLRRTFAATFELLPFGRDVAATTVQATSPPPATVTTALVNAASSTTGWTASVDGASATVNAAGGSYVGVTMLANTAVRVALLKITASIPMVTTSVIAVDWLFAGSPVRNVRGHPNLAGVVAGAGIEELARQSIGGGFNRSWFLIPGSYGSSLTSFAMSLEFDTAGYNAGEYSWEFLIDLVTRTNFVPGAGTNRQRIRSLVVGGSARGRASLAITADATKTLGDLTMIYTRTATTGFQPPLRPYRISSATVTTDTTLISGAYNSLGGTAMVFNIPANKFQEAAHDLVLRLRATTAGTYTITWTAALASSANADLTETAQSITGTTSVMFPAANTWQTNEVGLLQLPTVPVGADSTHMIRLTLLASNAVVQIDEGWLFDLDNGVLSWVNTTGLTRLEVRTADLTNPEPSYWGGTVDGGAATGLVRADWRTAPLVTSTATSGGSFAQHYFEPGTIDVFTVTSGTEGSSAAATYYRSWLHSAAA